MYAARKDWTIDRIAVRLRWAPEFTTIERTIDIDGPLDAEQRARLLQIAEKCPVHKILTGGVAVRSELAAAS
jgi:putative redox protein